MKAWVVLLLLGAMLAGCAQNEEAKPWFVENGASRGLDLAVASIIPAVRERSMESVTGGIALADIDLDGDLDVYITHVGPDVLYLNRGDGTFEDATARYGIHEPGIGRAALFADFDGDGYPDLVLAQFDEPLRMLHNDGGMRFVDGTNASGLGMRIPGHALGAADIDLDGDLDLFVGTYGLFTETVPNHYVNAVNGFPNLLFINAGNGTFREESHARGFTSTRWTLGASFADADGDGDPDLYVSNDFGPDEFYRNLGGGLFREEAQAVGLMSDRNGMGAVWADLDSDGDLDLYNTNIYVEGSRVPVLAGNNHFLLGSDGRFRDKAHALGTADALWAWGSAAFDADGDGDLEIYVANGFMSTSDGRDAFYDGKPEIIPVNRADNYTTPASEGYMVQAYDPWHDIIWTTDVPSSEWRTMSMAGHQPDRFFVNSGTFAEQAARHGLADVADTRAVVAFDADGDLDPDLLVTAYNQPLRFYENQAPRVPRLALELKATTGHWQAFGAQVLVEAGGTLLVQEKVAGSSFLSTASPELLFGLNGGSTANVAVRWPGGAIQHFPGLPAGRHLLIENDPIPR